HAAAARRTHSRLRARPDSRRHVRRDVSRRAVAVRIVHDVAGGARTVLQSRELRVLDGPDVRGIPEQVHAGGPGGLAVRRAPADRRRTRDDRELHRAHARKLDASSAEMRRAFLLPVVLFLALTAHVGSPNVVYEGAAGPYAVHVIVRPPMVVP